MKKNSWIYGIGIALLTTCLVSCKRDFDLKNPTSGTAGTASLRIIDASPNFRNIFNLPDTFGVFVNGTKITGNTPGASVLLTYNASFPTVSSLYGYASVPAGTNAIKLSVSGTVNADSIAIKTFTKTMLPDKLYTFMITDSINSTRDSSQIFVQDIFQQPTIGYFNLRFIHAIMNDTVGKTIDVWSTRTNRYIYTSVKPGTVTSFSQFPYNSIYSDTFFVRRSGTLITLDTLSTVSFSNQRTYTLYYRGNANSNSNSDTKRRHLGTFVHQ